MPEPVLYIQAMGVAAVVSAVCVLAVAARGILPRFHRGIERGLSHSDGAARHDAPRLNSACVLAVGVGILAGAYLLRWRFVWPPASGLDRFLSVVMPTTLVVELIAGFRCVRPAAAWFLRMILAA